MRTGRRTGGFTLIEVIVVIAVVSILAAMAVPYAVQIIDQSRGEATKKEMEDLHTAIMGAPKVPTAGYVGDMGRLPAALTNLNTQGTQAGPTTGTLGVKYGWYGPYVNAGFDPTGYLEDGWGTDYGWNNPAAGQIRSAGPDRTMNTADDLIYPPSTVVVTGRLLVNLYMWSNATSQYVLNPQPDPPFSGLKITIRMYYSANGAEANKSYTGTPSATMPPYVFTTALPTPAAPLSPHAGFHAVTATSTSPSLSGQAVVYIPGNNQQTVLNLYMQ